MNRKEGNKYFSNKEYVMAIESYTKGIEEEEEDMHLALSNRALCYYHLEDYSNALQDCIKLCKIKNDWFKGWFRLGQTLEKMGHLEESKVAMSRYEELVEQEKEKVENVKIIEENKEVLPNMNIPNINPEMMKNMMSDTNMMDMANKMMSNKNIREKLMNEDFKNKILGNPNLMKNPMEMMNDPSFQDIFKETLNILQQGN